MKAPWERKEWQKITVEALVFSRTVKPPKKKKERNEICTRNSCHDYTKIFFICSQRF